MKSQISKSKKFEKQLKRVPNEIRVKVKFWIMAVTLKGIIEVRKKPGYHDELLRGHRKGQRSIRLNLAYRLIYEELEKGIHIHLLEVNKHDYR